MPLVKPLSTRSDDRRDREKDYASRTDHENEYYRQREYKEAHNEILSATRAAYCNVVLHKPS